MDISIGQAVEWKYPNANPFSDFIVTDLCDGNGPFILEWNLSDPKPTQSDLDSWRFGLAQELAKQGLQRGFGGSLMQGFTSSADGTARIYGLDATAMSKWTGIMSVINAGTLTSNVVVKDLSGNQVSLTPQQFTQMATDGFAYFNQQEQKLWSLEEKVDAVDYTAYSSADNAISAVQSITWNGYIVAGSAESSSSSTANVTIS